jgi:hypothetical protein
MKLSGAFLLSLMLLGLFSGCAQNKEEARLEPSTEIMLRDIAALKTRAAAEAFVSLHSLPHSSEDLDTIKQRGEQVPSSAGGSVGRFSFTVFLDSSEAVAHINFYHYEQGHVTSIIIHIESVNKP